MIDVMRANFSDPGLERFVTDHLAELAPTAPEESRHALSFDGLRAPGVRLWAARQASEIVGMAALAALDSWHAELKSMRTSPAHRGRGIGSRLLAAALADAAARGIARVSLETGSAEYFAPARELYRGAGFVECGPFGSYWADPHSVFMTRTG